MFGRVRIRKLVDEIAVLSEQQVARWQQRGDHEDDRALRRGLESGRALRLLSNI